jgi:predicted acylesterase/phospholipase RssA
MCATLADKGECILFRSYKAPEDAKPISSKALAATKTHKGDLINQIDIATASRATSAAPTYLPEVVWKDMTFWDGGMLNNNPIDQLWAARYDLVGSTDPPPAVSCVLSLGTSWSSKKPNSWVRLVNTLNEASSFLTNTEAKHRDFERHIQRLKYRQEPDSKTEYFRFNTPTGDEEFSLDDYTKMEALKKLTLVYLEDELVKPKISTCADILIAGR